MNDNNEPIDDRPPATNRDRPSPTRTNCRASATTYDRLLRPAAEFDNYRKRTERERRARRSGRRRVIRDLLPLVDDLERALKAAPAPRRGGHRHGVELIQKQLLEILRRRGVAPIEALGDDFDPNFHEAVGTSRPRAARGRGHRGDPARLRSAIACCARRWSRWRRDEEATREQAGLLRGPRRRARSDGPGNQERLSQARAEVSPRPNPGDTTPRNASRKRPRPTPCSATGEARALRPLRPRRRQRRRRRRRDSIRHLHRLLRHLLRSRRRSSATFRRRGGGAAGRSAAPICATTSRSPSRSLQRAPRRRSRFRARKHARRARAPARRPAPRRRRARSAAAPASCATSRASSPSPGRARTAAARARPSPSRARPAAAPAASASERRVTVRIPAGIAAGQRLRLDGEGEHGGAGGPPATCTWSSTCGAPVLPSRGR